MTLPVVGNGPAVLLVLALFLPQRQCDIGSPDSIKGQFEGVLRTNFPNTRVVITPQRTIAPLTCTQGIGYETVKQIGMYIAGDRSKMIELSLLAPVLAGFNYKSILLGFDGGWIRYAFDTHTLDAVPMTPAALQEYRKVCGFSSE